MCIGAGRRTARRLAIAGGSGGDGGPAGDDDGDAGAAVTRVVEPLVARCLALGGPAAAARALQDAGVAVCARAGARDYFLLHGVTAAWALGALEGLAEVKRFDTMSMFMSKAQKASVAATLAQLGQHCAAGSEDRLGALRGKFSL